MSPVTVLARQAGRILSSVHIYGKFNSGYRDEKCPKRFQNTRGTTFQLVSDLTSHAQSKMFRPGQSRYPGWSVHIGKISNSVISASPPSHMNTSKFL